MPCAFNAAAKPSRSQPSGSRMVYCAQTEVQPPARARNGHDIAETARIALRDQIARGDLVLEDFQFLEQDRRLHGVEPAGEPEPDIVVFVRTLAVNADAAQRCGQFGIVGENRAAVAEAAERFGREKSWSRWQGPTCRDGGPCSWRRTPARRRRARTGPRLPRSRRSRRGRRSARTGRPESPPAA